MNDERTGRRVFLAVGGIVVLLSGTVGFFVGSNNAATSPTFEVFGTVSLPTSATSVALYGMLLAAVVVGGFFGAVAFASRYDDV